MGTTRYAETPPNFAPKTSQKWPEKLPNVASETLEKNNFWAAFGVAFLSLWSLQPCNIATRNSSTDGHHEGAETPPNFAPKTSQKWPEKLPNVASETLEKNDFWAAFGAAFLSLWSPQPCNIATRNSSTDGHHSKRWNTT